MVTFTIQEFSMESHKIVRKWFLETLPPFSNVYFYKWHLEIEAYLGPCETSMMEVLCENSPFV